MLRGQQKRSGAKAAAAKKAASKTPLKQRKNKFATAKKAVKTSHNTATTTTTHTQLSAAAAAATPFQRRRHNNINNLITTHNPLTQHKRTNYSFVNISGPKDDRYLEDGQSYDIPKAQLFDNTLVFSSLILERPPVCLKEVPKWEVDWYTYRHAKLTEKAWTLPKDLEMNMYGKQILLPHEFPDALPHITDEDLKDNRRSLYRALEDPLYLICKVQQDFDEKLPKEIWMFPTTQVRGGETIRTAAERTLFYHAGDLDYHTLGNTPILYHPVRNSAILKKEYPAAKQVKNFYMHSMYIGGNIELEPGGEITDYAWVTQAELAEYFDTDHTKDLLKLTGSSLYYLHPE